MPQVLLLWSTLSSDDGTAQPSRGNEFRNLTLRRYLVFSIALRRWKRLLSQLSTKGHDAPAEKWDDWSAVARQTDRRGKQSSHPRGAREDRRYESLW